MGKLFQDGDLGVWTKAGHYTPQGMPHVYVLGDKRAQRAELQEAGASLLH